MKAKNHDGEVPQDKQKVRHIRTLTYDISSSTVNQKDADSITVNRNDVGSSTVNRNDTKLKNIAVNNKRTHSKGIELVQGKEPKEAAHQVVAKVSDSAAQQQQLASVRLQKMDKSDSALCDRGNSVRSSHSKRTSSKAQFISFFHESRSTSRRKAAEYQINTSQQSR